MIYEGNVAYNLCHEVNITNENILKRVLQCRSQKALGY